MKQQMQYRLTFLEFNKLESQLIQTIAYSLYNFKNCYLKMFPLSKEGLYLAKSIVNKTSYSISTDKNSCDFYLDFVLNANDDTPSSRKPTFYLINKKHPDCDEKYLNNEILFRPRSMLKS